MLNVLIDYPEELRCTIEEGDELSLDLLGSAGEDIPSDQSNLILRAAKSFLERSNLKKKIHFQITKRVPPGSGCGAGSSNAATVLYLLHQNLESALTVEELLQLGLELGADVPFFLRALIDSNSVARVGGIGEEIAFEKPSLFADLPVVLFFGLEKLETPAVFKAFARSGAPVREDDFKMPTDYKELLSLIENDLEGAAAELSPKVGSVLRNLRELAPERVGMTGSGSAIFVLPKDESGFSEEELSRLSQLATEEGATVVQTEICAALSKLLAES